MKKFLPFIFIFIFSLAAVAQNTAAFKTNKHDFGIVERQKKEFIEATFELTNPDQTPLVIYKIDVSCGCISSSYPNKPIKKGETGTIKLRLDVRQLEGSFNKTAFVKTNAPKDNGVLLLRVTGTVK